MKVTCFKHQKGWTLLELLLVLVCVIALAAILLYSFVGPVGRQVSMQQVTANISQLIDAAHVWRHNHSTYERIDIEKLQKKGILSNDWQGGDSSTQYEITGNEDNNFKQCNRYNCFEIIVTTIPSACDYVNALQGSNPVTTKPDFNQCENHPGLMSSFKIIYE
jgi:type II secretory pathway pseudopilin PulG